MRRLEAAQNKKDTQVISDDTGELSILIEILQKSKDFKGTPQEIKLQIFPLILGTDIKKLNKQEIATIKGNGHLFIINILKNSLLFILKHYMLIADIDVLK